MNDTVLTFDPATPVRATATALRHLRERITASGAAGLRLGVKESGCTGYKYVLDLVSEARGDDLRVALGEGVTLWVDPDAIGIVRGTTIDYVREGVNSVLRFANPNAQDYCGCGESFNVATEAGG